MQRLIKILLKVNFKLIAICTTIAILYLSLAKVGHINIGDVTYSDKILHATAYFFLTFTWLLAFHKKASKKYIILSCCILFGIIIEVLQSVLTSYRTADYFDILANATGAFLALVIFNIIFRKFLLI